MNKEDINRLKNFLRLEEVAGRYMTLRRTGRSWTGLCPFHGDRHPSFSINPEKQTYTCYACGEKGDVFSFVRKMENCSFGEALERLRACSATLLVSAPVTHPLPPLKRGNVTPDTINGKTDALGKAESMSGNAQPSVTPEKFLPLLQPTASGHPELSGTWLDFEVGRSPFLVPPEWKAMRNRIIFPIRDEEGVLVGFAARRLSDTDTGSPKYINSAASEHYRKSELLYGLYRAREAIRQDGYVFVVEGYKDVLAMHAAGFINTVALCGTALCAGHIGLLKKYTSQIYLLLDGDNAGRSASLRAASLLGETGMDVAACRLPEGEDPDSLFRMKGKAPFRLFVETLRQEVAPSDEVVLLRRIRRGIDLLSALPEPEKRGPLLTLLNSCINRLAELSRQAGRPATLDWRWV